MPLCVSLAKVHTYKDRDIDVPEQQISSASVLSDCSGTDCVLSHWYIPAME